MRLRGLPLAMIGLFAVAAAVAAGPGLAASDPDRLADIARERMEADGVAGVVIVLIADGRPVWTGAFGMADPAAGLAMTTDALFRVESISKPVTAWGVVRLALSGQLDLDAPIDACLTRWHLPEAAAR
ncbi:MAG: class A beta-lactamase-related serine hydrolase, partial [Rhodobacteraceae bacterium]